MIHQAYMPARPVEFRFAGFEFPRYLAIMPTEPLARRLADRKRPACVGEAYTLPKPNDSRPEFVFYLPRVHPRIVYCDEVCREIRHKGWYSDDDCSSTIRGIVIRLPHGRMIAGWSMGEGMYSGMDTSEVFSDPREAALRADDLAHAAADFEREYQDAESARLEAEFDESALFEVD